MERVATSVSASFSFAITCTAQPLSSGYDVSSSANSAPSLLLTLFVLVVVDMELDIQINRVEDKQKQNINTHFIELLETLYFMGGGLLLVRERGEIISGVDLLALATLPFGTLKLTFLNGADVPLSL